MIQLRIESPLSTGPQWLKNILDEEVLNKWWSDLDYESKWAIACHLASAGLSGKVRLKEVELSQD